MSRWRAFWLVLVFDGEPAWLDRLLPLSWTPWLIGLGLGRWPHRVERADLLRKAGPILKAYGQAGEISKASLECAAVGQHRATADAYDKRRR